MADNIGNIYVALLKNATLNNPASSKNGTKIPYQKYNIKETDWRIKTATFTSPQYLDLTAGQFVIWIKSKYHENFGGFILDVEYDEKTGLYTYQCQDWSRKYIAKFEWVVKNANTYRILRWLITRGAIPVTRAPTAAERKEHKEVLSGLKDIILYDQSYYTGNIYRTNPMKQNLTLLARDKSWIEVIRDIVYSRTGFFDVWFNDKGIIQIEPISRDDWENTGLHLSASEYHDRKFKFSTTNAITGVVVNGNNLEVGQFVNSKTELGLDLSAFFGSVSSSIANPIQPKKDTSNAVKSNTANNTTNKYGNPYNNKPKKIIVSADGGSESFYNQIIPILQRNGWSVNGLGVGPGTHSTSYNILSSGYSVNCTIYNGADPETIKEPVTGWLKGKHEKFGVQLVQMFDTHDWTNPQGMKPYRYGNFDGYTCHKAWDDNYSGKSDAQATISNLGAWYKQYYPHVIHVCGPTAGEAYNQFAAGGYLKSKGLK